MPIRELVRRAATAYGVATASDLADYWRIKDRPAVMTAIGELQDAGELRLSRSRAGRRRAAPRRRGCTGMPRSPAASMPRRFSPRSIPWCGSATVRSACSTSSTGSRSTRPPPKRRYGYYSLPVLVGDDIVGRVDLKADRASSTLLVQSAWWEHGRPADAAARVADELRAAARWQGLESISVSRWGDAVDDLAAVLTEARRHEAGAPEPVALAEDEPTG